MDEMCAECKAELDHCHGTLIVHLESGLECTDDGCVVLDPARHDLIVGCDSLARPCACQVVSSVIASTMIARSA